MALPPLPPSRSLLPRHLLGLDALPGLPAVRTGVDGAGMTLPADPDWYMTMQAIRALLNKIETYKVECNSLGNSNRRMKIRQAMFDAAEDARKYIP